MGIHIDISTQNEDGTLLIVAACLAGRAVLAAADSRGFDDDIEWLNSIEEGKAASAETGKPLVVLIHKTWCGACKNLKRVFAGSSKVAEAAKDFVMVNLEDDEEPTSNEYKPDGGYIPRLFFHDADGEVDPDVVDPNDRYRYFYASEDQLLDAFKAGKAKHGAGGADGKNEL